ncbi:hypothetical protein HELRODRAFT_191158 [Helobdella robusta]|uniref:carbonic anhydrase n=1 Tax=Helobdella robusta TaxID=6412 RepID=T1FSN8_HELRO|nr:hypothetical protein HELRODRAFT_191158 [Helobdella robusta]ESO07372.1 hypothetical protein HELRODRAFT_191158 [Helobdella robusta]
MTSSSNSFLLIIIFFISTIIISSSLASPADDTKGKHSTHWNYEDQEAWSTGYQSCSGNRQSPIDISLRDVQFDEQLPNIEFVGDFSSDATIVNNGHTVNIILKNPVRLVGGGLDGDFRVAGVHFHWGVDRFSGSEHTFNNTRLPLEMHIVTYKESGYLDFSEAAQGINSLAVYGVLFRQVSENNIYLNPLVNVLKQASYSSKPILTKGPLNVEKLLPLDYDSHYLRYFGSLTTPPCTENVIWTIAIGTSTISEKQLNEFRNLRIVDVAAEAAAAGETTAAPKMISQMKLDPPKLDHNWRWIQDKKNRKVRSTVTLDSQKFQNLNLVNGRNDGNNNNRARGFSGSLVIFAVCQLLFW